MRTTSPWQVYLSSGVSEERKLEVAVRELTAANDRLRSEQDERARLAAENAALVGGLAHKNSRSDSSEF